ncbi:MAG: glycosyltransferase family 2 protein [Firmicutes bacterium HGW-Firmicutes-3]|jgi:dolichol-phosphate mannosyltransferase|nr:MAG: glycosyltransferase family 2 protein [Firmicutes bacterium HGW-Firmicutes-3]
MSKTVDFYVVLPCYNEALNIEKVVKDFQETYHNHQTARLKFILINDGSKDNTIDILRNLECIHEEIYVIDHVINKGLGAAVKTGMEYVLSKGSAEDFMLILDSDHTHKACYSLEMFNKAFAKHFDVVIASRFYPGSKIFGVPIHRKILSIFARWYYTALLNIPNVKDYTCGYRVYSLSILRKLYARYGTDIVEETGFSCMVELLLKLNNVDAVIGESTFKLYYGDKGGASSMQIFKTIRNSLRMPLKLQRYKNSINYCQEINE